MFKKKVGLDSECNADASADGAGAKNQDKEIADIKRKKMYDVNEYKKRSNRKSLKSKPKIVKKVLVNLMTNTVYDYNQMKKSGTPIKIGKIDKSGKMIK